jgi:tight adherence protein C
MHVDVFIGAGTLLTSPLTFGALIGLAAVLIWIAFSPVRPGRAVRKRLDGYTEAPTTGDVVEREEMRGSIVARILLPAVRRVFGTLGRLAPKAAMEATQKMLIHAGSPGGLTVLDFYGLRLLVSIFMGAGWFAVASRHAPFANAMFSAPIIAGIGFFFPVVWLRGRVARRKHDITRALPNALDMLTIGVEAGLAFESAMLRVAEQWNNALTREFGRAVLEMRVGSSRDVALGRLAERTDVTDLRTFVAVLVQSSQLGVSIAQVLHNQAAVMREKRRQRAEELARQAGVKMAFPLVFLIFPAMFVVVLGPALPGIVDMLGGVLG